MVPMSPEVFGGLRGAQPGEPMADKLQYQRVVGSLSHLAQCSRPDIALPVAALAAYSSAPSTQHYAVLLDIARHVGRTASGESRTEGRDNHWNSDVTLTLPHAKIHGEAPLDRC
jgi:hypothetical protein